MLVHVHHKCLRHWQRLADARALDHQVVERVLLAEALHSLEQVAAERAADAAVVQLDHLGLFMDKLRMLDLIRVEVDLAHVVHDDGHLQPITLRALCVLAQNTF
jgi:hypothetical protein